MILPRQIIAICNMAWLVTEMGAVRRRAGGGAGGGGG